MKKLVLLAVAVLGTSVMVNAQTTPAQAAPTKEVKATKHHHKGNKKAKAEAPKEDAATMKK
ncbi:MULTISPECIES: hypothetical protein [unclassified Flavobacterium]|uniref:hypothetical protein n=1 Tax=unclassified Flavobacterium TaxID=196869 RepID=UPI0013687516|nr:hypothetical protein [Flavobacterium sp. HBTb2-11-1]MXO03763.1 hypothetical protein [Flavobacterium sp. HBTb2-11-1]